MTVLEILILILTAVWLGSFVFVAVAADSLVHLILVVVLLLVAIRLLQGRRL